MSARDYAYCHTRKELPLLGSAWFSLHPVQTELPNTRMKETTKVDNVELAVSIATDMRTLTLVGCQIPAPDTFPHHRERR